MKFIKRIKQKLNALEMCIHKAYARLTESETEEIVRKLSELMALAEAKNTTSHHGEMAVELSQVVEIYWESALKK